MIDNFLRIATEGGWGGGGGHWTLWFLPYNAACSDDSSFFFIKDRSSLQYFIKQGMGQSSMFLTFHTNVILGGGLRLWVEWEEGKEESQGGSIPVYYEACLKTQPAHKPLIHHNEKHDFFFHLVNSATMEINYEDVCILQFGQSQ